jgi:hypothetical protein
MTARIISRKKAQKAQASGVVDCVLEDVFADLEFAAAEIDEQTMLDPAGAEVAEQLCDVLVVQSLHGFDFHEQRLGNEQVGPEVAKNGAVLIVNRQRELAFHFQPLLAKPVQQRILVDFLNVSIPVIAVDGKTGFADYIAQLEDFLSVHSSISFLRFFEPFRGQSL